MRSLLGLLTLATLVSALLACGASPRFTPEVQASFREHPMARMETARTIAYFPEHRRSETEELIRSVEACMGALDRFAQGGYVVDEKVVLIVPEVEFNNAYVSPAALDSPHTVVPPYFTWDRLFEIGLEPLPGFVACHEAVHYAQALHIYGPARFMRQVFGELLSPQLGFDPWFWEGLAVHYESQLNPGLGRMNSPLWRATFQAGVAAGGLHAGSLHIDHRQPTFNGAYLVGSHFLEWLITTKGEDAVWRAVRNQGRALLPFLGVQLRTRSPLDGTLASHFRTFRREMEALYVPRESPQEIERISDAGQMPTLHVARDGRSVLTTVSPDSPPRVAVIGPDGREIAARTLPPLFGEGGLRFAGIDSARLVPHRPEVLLHSLEFQNNRYRTRLVAWNYETNRFSTLADDLRGGAGDITPDGAAYVYPRAERLGRSLVYLPIDGAGEQVLLPAVDGAVVGHPRVSPDGTRVVALLVQAGSRALVVLPTPGAQGEPLVLRGIGGFLAQPSWWDDEHLIVHMEVEGHLQPFIVHLASGRMRQQAEAPWAIMAAQRRGDDLVFLSLEGWEWALARTTAVLPAFGSEGSTDEDSYRFAVRTPQIERTPWEAVGPSPQLTLPQRVVLDIESTTPYRRTDGLLIPRTRGAFFLYLPETWSVDVGAMGRDELGFHNWALGAGLLQRKDDVVRWQGSLGYVGGWLAPAYPFMDIRQDQSTAELRNLAGESTSAALQTRSLRLGVVRPTWAGIYGASLFAMHRDLDVEEPERNAPAPVGGDQDLLFLGADVETYWARQHAVARGGVYAGVAGGVRVSGWVSDDEALDLGLDPRVEASAWIPLPWSRRHHLRLRTVGRWVWNDEGLALLTVGGISPDLPLYSSRDNARVPQSGSQALLPLSFQEAVRGFDDLGFLAERVVTGDLRYRLILPVDRGTMSVFWILPALLVRDIGVEAFGSGFTELEGAWHAAVGGALTLDVTWLLPLRLGAQIAQRLTDDQGTLFTLYLGLD